MPIQSQPLRFGEHTFFSQYLRGILNLSSQPADMMCVCFFGNDDTFFFFYKREVVFKVFV